MSIRIVQHTIGEGEGDKVPQRVVHTFAKDRLLVGSHAKCDLALKGIPDITFSIERNDQHDYTIERKDKDVAIRINSTSMDDDIRPLRNGDRISVGAFELHFVIEFNRAALHRSVGIAAHMSSALIAVILLFEIGVIAWLPRQVQSRELWGLEITRQRTVDLMDILRHRCGSSVAARDDVLYAESVQFIQAELDSLAIYLRTEIDVLDMDTVMDVQADLEMYERMLNKLDADQLYPPPVTIQADEYLDKILAD